MMSGIKRNGPSDGPTAAKKKPRVDRDMDTDFVASSQEDLDIKLLRIQNRRLSELRGLKEREKNELKALLEQQQMKHSEDQLKIFLVNRVWNQLNDDMRLMLQRFEDQIEDGGSTKDSSTTAANNSPVAASPDTADESSNHAVTRSLGNCDKEELEEQMNDHTEISKLLLSKLMTVFDRVVQRNENVMRALKGNSVAQDKDELDDDNDVEDEIDDETSEHKEATENGGAHSGDQPKRRKRPGSDLVAKIDQLIRQQNEELTLENKRLHRLMTKQRERHQKISTKFADMENSIEVKETQIDELKNRIDDLEFELSKARTREQRNETTIRHMRDRLAQLQEAGVLATAAAADAVATAAARSAAEHANGGLGMPMGRVDDLKLELEEQRELAASRLTELEALNEKHKETLKLVEDLKLDLRCLPINVIHETSEFKAMQSHFSILCNEANHLKTQLEETRTQLLTAKTVHMAQIEQMEREELNKQKELRADLISIEEKLAHKQNELQILRLDVEQTLAANEQTAPLKSEIQKLYKSHQHHQELIETEINRRKKKLAEAHAEIVRLRRLLEGNNIKPCCGLGGTNQAVISVTASCSPMCCLTESTPQTSTSAVLSALMSDDKLAISDSSNDGVLVIKEESNDDISIKKDEPSVVKNEDDSTCLSEPAVEESQVRSSSSGSTPNVYNSKHFDRLKEELKEMKAKLKSALESNKELKIILDQYKSENKEKRDKVMMMADVRKQKIENEELRAHIKRLQESERRGDKKRLTEEEYGRKIGKFEEVIEKLQKDVASHKHEEEIMLREMEVTGQAFEDMQEQNHRLLQQLKEKDDANFKLMSEMIKANQIQAIMREEKDALNDQLTTISGQLELRNSLMRKLEEKERLLQVTLTTSEKEAAVRHQEIDYLKRKAVESGQMVADLRLHMDKYTLQVKDSQAIVADKTSAWQQEAFKNKRLHEEVLIYKRKYERAKKFELASTADEVLQEEIRELKEELTCPSCKTKRKDAVLNKCFHVFCYDCLKTRYETRQRKCPKCNQSFSSNDFHRLYLA